MTNSERGALAHAIVEGRAEDFDPCKGFDSPYEAISYAETQPDPVEAAKQIVLANIDMGEFGFASEVCLEIQTIGHQQP